MDASPNFSIPYEFVVSSVAVRPNLLDYLPKMDDFIKECKSNVNGVRNDK